MLTCHPDKFKSRMFPSKIVNLSFFLSQALGQLPWGPLQRLSASQRAPLSLLSFSRLRRCRPWGAGLGCRLGRPLGNVPPGRSGPNPRKFFEKNLTKNFTRLRRARRDFTPLRGSLLRRTVYTRLRRCTRSTPGGCCRPCRFCGRPKASPDSLCGKTSERSPPKTPP